MDKIITVLGYKNFITEMSDAPDCLQSKFGYCIIAQTLNIALCKRNGITDKQTDGWSDY